MRLFSFTWRCFIFNKSVSFSNISKQPKKTGSSLGLNVLNREKSPTKRDLVLQLLPFGGLRRTKKQKKKLNLCLATTTSPSLTPKHMHAHIQTHPILHAPMHTHKHTHEHTHIWILKRPSVKLLLRFRRKTKNVHLDALHVVPRQALTGKYSFKKTFTGGLPDLTTIEEVLEDISTFENQTKMQLCSYSTIGTFYRSKIERKS